MSYRLTVRRGPKVEREKAETLDEAIEAAKRVVRGSRRREAVSALGRSYEPSGLLSIRIEIKGGGRRGGLDVLGDGGLVAFTGRWNRRVIGAGEDPYEALRRALTA